MILKTLSCFVFLLINLGLIYRKNRRRHVRLMSAAFVIDLLLVLYIELTKNAVKTAVHPPHAFILFHVVVSVLVLVGYVAQIILGRKLLKGAGADVRKTHIRVGASFYVLRLTNLVTSFFVEGFL